jgi:hypothetical protein
MLEEFWGIFMERLTTPLYKVEITATTIPASRRQVGSKAFGESANHRSCLPPIWFPHSSQ